VSDVQPFTGRALVRAAVALVLGAVVGTVGTVAHRAIQPWGVVLALALVLVAGIAVRAWSGFVSVVAYAGGVLLLVQVLAQKGPGGDVLVPAASAIGWVWIIGAAVMIGGVALAPRRWFSDVARGRPAPVDHAPVDPAPVDPAR